MFKPLFKAQKTCHPALGQQAIPGSNSPEKVLNFPSVIDIDAAYAECNCAAEFGQGKKLLGPGIQFATVGERNEIAASTWTVVKRLHISEPGPQINL